MQVYGVTEARVEVGYQYRDCAAVVRVTQLAALQGFPVDISGVGGWNLDIHHHYNPHQGDRGHGTRAANEPSTNISQSRSRPLLGPSPGWKCLLAL